ncbi:MAG: aspartate/glutamate racemase family protein, partial [Rhodobacteraceae bacterium]|nr:aspartate/glutamate racemase family protein [Paracoccaceae bacterium]
MRRGGKTVYGATVGILMLETRFPRIPGDMGNALTWPFPVQYRVVRGASPDRVVRGDPRELTGAFIAAGHDLIAAGCDGITTNCGFLALVQEQLRAALGVPVATSSLMQVPMVQAMLPPGRRVAILTVSEATLSA